MKTLKIFFTLVLASVLSLSYAQSIDIENSTITWNGKKVTGEHSGNIALKSAALEVKGDQIVSGNFVMDMNSITNTDVKSDEYRKKLVDHLKSDDFFGVNTYPTATFTVTEATPFKNGKAQVNGKLTIKKSTEDISFDVVKTSDGYNTTLEVDRSKFDVRYGSKSFFDNLGDKVIYDIFTLDIQLKTK